MENLNCKEEVKYSENEGKGKNPNYDNSSEMTPFSADFPLSTWQGRSSAIIELSTIGQSCWIYISFQNPDDYQKLNVTSQNNHEIIFFSSSAKKYYRLTDDILCWSYHSSGPFQTMESGNWIIKNQEAQGQNNPKNNASYSDIANEIIKNVMKIEKSKSNLKKGEDIAPEQQKNLKHLDLDSLRQQTKINPAKVKENEVAWKEVDSLVKKLHNNPEIANFREVIAKSNGKETAEIKKNEIVDVFEEILSSYGLDFEHNRNLVHIAGIYLYPIENMNDIKFTLGIVLPEFCLYPKSLFQALGIRTIVFSGEILLGGKRLGARLSGSKLYLNCKERNAFKIQQSFHDSILEKIEEKIHEKLPEFKQSWESLNPNDFVYGNKQQTSENLKRFLNLSATESFHNDLIEIFFGLIKNSEAVSNYKDSCVSKKGELLKDVMSAIYTDSLNEDWWNRVKTYEEAIKLNSDS